MAEMKTKPTDASVERFLGRLDDARQQDCRALIRIMRQATKSEPRMWGPSIVGFGTYHYTYDSGREGDWFLAGFAPRKQDLTLYIMAGFGEHGSLLRKLGKHRTGKSCLYIKRLADVDRTVLRQLVAASVRTMKKSGGRGASYV